jgi:hypothetical protein
MTPRIVVRHKMVVVLVLVVATGCMHFLSISINAGWYGFQMERGDFKILLNEDAMDGRPKTLFKFPLVIVMWFATPLVLLLLSRFSRFNFELSNGLGKSNNDQNNPYAPPDVRKL